MKLNDEIYARIAVLSTNELKDRVHNALRAWDKVISRKDDLLDGLVLYQDVTETAVSSLATTAASVPMPRLKTNRVLSNALAKLDRQNQTFAEILNNRFVLSKTLGQTSELLDMTLDQIRHNQRQAIEELTAIILHDEIERRKQRIHEIESKMPPPTYSELFGCDEALNLLVDQILSAETSFVVAITGIGGIGKTALADKVTRTVVGHFRFNEIVWIRADALSLDNDTLDYSTAIDLFANEIAKSVAPEVTGNTSREARLARVRQVLKEDPHLIVIDNLETISNTAFLMRQLQDWASPSKFLLTTRVRPIGEASVFSYSVDTLGDSDSGNLLRHHAQIIGQPDLAIATDEQAAYIYNIVGGNPLALKLVVSLAMTMPVDFVLDDLTQGNTAEVGLMYDRIYKRTWQVLTHTQRRLLRAMPLVAESGGSVDQIRAITALDDAELWPAMNDLVNRSLLELLGTTWERRYGIHRLTASFLQTSINHWDEEDDDDDEELKV